LPLEELLITGGTGVLTLVFFTGKVRYSLEAGDGRRVNQLRVGEVVTASGKDSDGRLVAIPQPLETVSLGPPTLFRGPYQEST
jgi:hypothetical protein